jgi:hypothetical protein
MPAKRPKPKFSGALAEPIYEPVSSGLLAMPDDEERHRERVVDKLKEKHEMLLDHYTIDKSNPDKWYILSIRLAIDYVPGMEVYLDRPPKPGRKRTWKAGQGAELLHAVEAVMQQQPYSKISNVIAQLRRSTHWSGFTPQNLATRLREEKRKRRLHRMKMSQLLSGPGPYSIAQLAEAYFAGQVAHTPVLGIAGLGQSVSQRGSSGDENSGK